MLDCSTEAIKRTYAISRKYPFGEVCGFLLALRKGKKMVQEDIYRESNKEIAAYLSLLPEITFEGTESRGDYLSFLFSPSNLASQKASDYFSKKAEPVQPKDLIDAVDGMTDLVMRFKRQRNEGGTR